MEEEEAAAVKEREELGTAVAARGFGIEVDDDWV